jgi:hypothetical protein
MQGGDLPTIVHARQGHRSKPTTYVALLALTNIPASTLQRRAPH